MLENEGYHDKEPLKDAIPLYHQIVAGLKEQINAGELVSGEKIPTEKWLSEHYGVSRVTVRKALENLTEEGYVEKRPNKGCYVLQPKFEKNFSRMRSLHQELVDAGITPSSKIISYQEVEADSWVCKHLGCKQGEIVLVIKRIRYADERPFAEQTIYLPKYLFEDFNPWLLKEESLHDIMEKQYHVEILHSEQNITATMSEKEKMRELDLKKEQPILHIRSTVYTKDDKICEYSDTYFLTNVVRYSFAWFKE